MKLVLLSIVLMMTIALNAQTKHPHRKNTVPVAPVSNAASTSGSSMSGVSDKPVGGAGSKVGKPVD